MKKWKITKGREEDFIGAPDWCRQVSAHVRGALVWEENFGVLGAKYQDKNKSQVWELDDSGSNEFFTVIAERIEQKAEVTWDNCKEFPPVGTEVKFWYEDEYKATYMRGVVVYSSEKGATVDVGFLTSSGEWGDFAPVTEDDREKDVGVSQMLEFYANFDKDNFSMKDFFSKMYDAGYRRQVK